MSEAQTADPIPEAPADEEVEGVAVDCVRELRKHLRDSPVANIWLDTIVAALRRSTETDKPGVREGWKLVPVEPTIEMLDAMPSLPAIKLADPLAGRLKPAQYQNRVRYLAALSASPLTREDAPNV